jgi:hypothetical protein
VFGLPHGRAPKNQPPNKESHPIHSIQEVFGSALRVAAWKPLFVDKRASKLLKPIYVLCGTDADLKQLNPEKQSDAMALATDELPASVIAIYKLWLARNT